MTYEELVEEISSLPYSMAMQEYTADADHAEDDVAEAMAELSVAANLARALGVSSPDSQRRQQGAGNSLARVLAALQVRNPARRIA